MSCRSVMVSSDGPLPRFKQYRNLDQEFQAIAGYCRELIQDHGVQSSDICLIYKGKTIKCRLAAQIAPALAALGVERPVQTNKACECRHNILHATTSHSFKGYEAAVVIVPALATSKNGRKSKHRAACKMIWRRSLMAWDTGIASGLSVCGTDMAFPRSR